MSNERGNEKERIGKLMRTNVPLHLPLFIHFILFHFLSPYLYVVMFLIIGAIEIDRV